MAKVALLIAIFGLLAHFATADVSHVINKSYLPPKTETSQELTFVIQEYLPPPLLNVAPQDSKSNVPLNYPEVELLPPKPNTAMYSSLNNQLPVNVERATPQISPAGGQRNQYKGPAYLPPVDPNHNKYLPPPIKPPHPQVLNTNIHPSLIQTGAQYKGPAYLPPKQNSISAGKSNSLHPIQHKPLVQDLPDGYDFVKPENAAEAIAELHKLPAHEPHHEAKSSQSTAEQKATIRTVQIINSAGNKTLKVLETVHDGIKHIKILGQTNDIPNSSHYVVKVESPSSCAQTVKIFNDHKSVDANNNEQSNFPINSYLPPSHVNHKRSVFTV